MSRSRSDEHHKNIFAVRLVLIIGFTILEFTSGVLTGSLALVTNATHNLTDSPTLLVSLLAKKIVAKPANENKTCGYGSATIIAALLNAGILVAIAPYETIVRFSNPREIDGVRVAAVATFGIVINSFIAWKLSRQKHDLNVRSACSTTHSHQLVQFWQVL